MGGGDLLPVGIRIRLRDSAGSKKDALKFAVAGGTEDEELEIPHSALPFWSS
jgi:hypothetical protein